MKNETGAFFSASVPFNASLSFSALWIGKQHAAFSLKLMQRKWPMGLQYANVHSVAKNASKGYWGHRVPWRRGRWGGRKVGDGALVLLYRLCTLFLSNVGPWKVWDQDSGHVLMSHHLSNASRMLRTRFPLSKSALAWLIRNSMEWGWMK